MSRQHHYLHSLLILGLALPAMTVTSQEPDTSTAAVVKAAAEYVADYQQRLTSVLADESSEQEVVRRVPLDREAARSRRMVSEVFFMFTPGSNHWMAIRDVMSVDGKPVADRPDIRQSLETLDDDEVARRLKALNSRFNIGRVTRNFSEPTFSLLVLDDEHRDRFTFERRRVVKNGGTVLVTLAFTEKKTPTLIRDITRGRIFTTGDIVVETGSGRVRETSIRARSGDLDVELTTKYVADEGLGMWVPDLFRESYQAGVNPRSFDVRADYEHVVALSTYRNYRRFQTAVRIK